MKRLFYIRLSWICLLACLIVCLALTHSLLSDQPDAEALKDEWLGRSQAAMQLKLHSGLEGDQYLDGTEQDFYHLPGNPQSRIDLPDGRRFDQFARADGSPALALEYYKLSPSGRMLKHAVKFAPDGKTPQAEIAFRPSGKRQLTGARMANGDYRANTYGDDGEAILSETFVGLGPDKYNKIPLLLRQTKWSDSGKLTYTFVLNQDMSRTFTNYDDNEEAIQVSQLLQSVKDSTVVGYYPGTKVLRLTASSTYEQTTVDYFRPDSTQAMRVEISSGMINYTFFDATGKLKTLQQSWFFDREVKDGITRMKNFRLEIITEMDANGDPLHSWDLKVGTRQPWSTGDFNVSVNGVHWKEVHYFYSQEGFLNRVSYIDDKDVVQNLVDHEPSEGLRPTEPPPRLTILTPIDDLFAIPVPNTSSYH